MPDTTADTASFALQALEYGVLGLCAITLVLVVGIIRAEQRREGSPRRGIIQLSLAFMAFSVALAGLNGYVQLRERTLASEDMQNLRTQLESSEAEIQAAARTISSYKQILVSLDGLIDLKVEDEILNPDTSPPLRAVAQKLKDAMDRARETGLLEP